MLDGVDWFAFAFSLWVVSTCVLICLVFFFNGSGFPSLILIYKGFSSFEPQA
jgi:hypothetical protein